MAEIQFEPFQKQYEDQVINLIVGIQRGEFNICCSIVQQPDLKNIPNIYQKGNGGFWIARDQEKIIGTIALLDIGDQVCALKKIYVDKKYRGKEKTVAKNLLDILLAFAKGKSVKTIYLGTVPVYHAAHRFYEKNDFNEILREELPDSFPVMEVDKKFYKISIL